MGFSVFPAVSYQSDSATLIFPVSITTEAQPEGACGGEVTGQINVF